MKEVDAAFYEVLKWIDVNDNKVIYLLLNFMSYVTNFSNFSIYCTLTLSAILSVEFIINKLSLLINLFRFFC